MLNLYSKARGEYIRKYQFDLPSGTPIVGRQRELALLTKYYETAKHGITHVALVSGEAGIGKTCLLNEVARRACQDGAIVLRGSGSDADGMPLYLPFLEALSQYLQEIAPDQLQKQGTPATNELNRILSEILSLSDVLPARQSLPPQQAHFRLHKAVGEFLENIAFTRTLVLLFDDLQWADRASLDLLCSITHHHPHARLLIFGAYSTHKLDSNMLLEHTLAELTHQRILTAIELPPLTLDEVEVLALSILQDSVSPDVCSLLYEQSEGNPFFAEELLQSWVETGVLRRKDQQWSLDASRERVLPPGIVGLLRQRFLQLAPECIGTLRLAATMGRTFSLALLATVAEQEREELEECLLEAERAGLIQSSQAGVFTFCHEKIRECLYAEISISRRQRLHEALGLALESHYYQEENAKNAQFASLVFCLTQRHELEHCQLSPQHAEAQTQQNILVKEAAHHYRTALELLPRDDQRRGYLLQRLGKAASLAACEEEAASAYADGSVLLGQLGDLKAAASAMQTLGVVRWRQGRLAEAQIALERALQILGVCSCVETVRVLLDLALLLTHSLEQPVDGLAYAQRALEMAHTLENAHLETMAKQVAARNQDVQSSDLRPITQREELALNLTQEQGEFLDAGACCLALTKYAYWLGEIKHAHKISALRIALIESSRQLLPYQALTAYTWPALLLIC